MSHFNILGSHFASAVSADSEEWSVFKSLKMLFGCHESII